MEVIIAGTNPAAVGGTERYDGLSGKVIRFQKCADNTGSLSMPNRITKKNCESQLTHHGWKSKAF